MPYSDPVQSFTGTPQYIVSDELARSVDVPSMPYITPCDVDRSYFWHKCAGTQTSVGGSGRTMPTRGSLSAEQLALLRAWIEAGAPE